MSTNIDLPLNIIFSKIFVLNSSITSLFTRKDAVLIGVFVMTNKGSICVICVPSTCAFLLYKNKGASSFEKIVCTSDEILSEFAFISSID